MAQVSVTAPLFTVNADARPSNYLINHVSWSAPSEAINWSEIKVIRNTTGYPMNINDGVQVFSEQPYSVIGTVNTVYTSSSVSAITHTGGGTYGSGNLYDYYTAITGTASASGSGASFDIVRSKDVLGAVSSITINSAGGDYAVGETITVSKNKIGFLNSDGVTADPAGTGVTDLVITVSAVGAGTSGIKTITLTQPTLQNVSNATSVYSNVAAVSTDTSIGRNATFNVSRAGNGTVATTTTTLRATGANYKVNDIIRVPGYSIGGRVSALELGIDTNYHIYDKGETTAATVNPGYEVTGTDLRASKYYYSIFIKYVVNGETLPRWKRVAAVSSFAVKDSGALNVILNHIPLFYRKDYQGKDNKDLKDFIRLFAFHYDTYLAQSNAVFTASDPNNIDDKLLALALKQFGFDINDVASITQAKVALSQLIKAYQTSGSTEGFKNRIQVISGYDVNINAGRNLLTDYNASSFIESTESWYLDPAFYTATTYAATLSLVGPIATGTSTIGSYTNTNGVTMTNASSSGYVITVPSTEGLKSGAAVTKTAGTGAFAVGTVVTSIDSATQFKVNIIPTTTLSGATIVSSSILTSGMGKITVTGTTSVPTFKLGLKNTVTATNHAANTNTITIKPIIAAVGDYVIASTTIATTGATVNYVPYNTVVTAVSTAGVVTLSKNIVSAIATGTSVLFSTPPASDKIGALTSTVLVEPGKPYAFNIKANRAGTAAVIVTASINWLDKTGTAISGTSGTLSTTAQSSGTTWYTAEISGSAPANAIYAQPSFSAAHNYFVDAAQFEGGIPVSTAQIASNVATLGTDIAHGFTTSNSVTVYGLGAPFDGTYTISTTPTTTSFSYAKTAADQTLNAPGLAASASTFQDARNSAIQVLANRRNLIPNPSFTTATTGWSVSTSAVTVTSTSAQQIFGTTSAKVDDTNATANASVYVTDRIAVTPSTSYTFSAYAKWGSGAGVTYNVEIDWYVAATGTTPAITTSVGAAYYTSAGTLVATAPVPMSSATGWNRLFVSALSPDNANFAVVKVVRKDTTGNTSTIYVDSCLFEPVSVLKHYFDGSYDGQNYSSDRDSVWESTADNSVSHLYYNRVFNIGKIDSLILEGMYYA